MELDEIFTWDKLDSLTYLDSICQEILDLSVCHPHLVYSSVTSIVPQSPLPQPAKNIILQSLVVNGLIVSDLLLSQKSI